MHALTSELPHITIEILERLRRRSPRVHCITNAVAQTFTANVLLAAGAVPTMTVSSEEVAEFVKGADALLVNLGTLDAGRREAAGLAVDAAAERGIPWIVDPTFVDRSANRAAFAQALIAMHPRAIRLNGAEFTALVGAEPNADAARRFAGAAGVVVGLTGARDLVASGTATATIENGDPLMAKITALGCATSALVTACQAVETDAWSATAAGILLIGIAGEVAAKTAHGPGSLAVAIIDTLHALDRATILSNAKVG
jgi:hydroxyethylthiazole kinase